MGVRGAQVCRSKQPRSTSALSPLQFFPPEQHQRWHYQHRSVILIHSISQSGPYRHGAVCTVSRSSRVLIRLGRCRGALVVYSGRWLRRATSPASHHPRGGHGAHAAAHDGAHRSAGSREHGRYDARGSRAG